MLALNGTTDWRPHQNANRDEGERLTHARPDLAPVRAEQDEDGGRQRHKGAAEEAVQDTKHNKAAEVLDGDEAQDEHAGQQGTGDDGIKAADAVGQHVGEDAAEGAGGVHDGQHVEGQVLAGDAAVEGVQLDVEEGRVQAHEDDHGAGNEEHVGRLLEGGQVEHLAPRWRQHAHAHTQVRDEQRGEGDEADDAGGPGEADGADQAVQHDGVDDAADAAAGGGDAGGGGQACGEVGAEDGNAGNEEAAGADADAEGLGQEDLPVLSAETEHHLAEDDEE